MVTFWASQSSVFCSVPKVSHQGIFYITGSTLSEAPPVVPKFPLYDGGGVRQLSPTWILTSPDVSSVHRFFDTSPFSPTGRYVGITRMGIKENRFVKIGDTAEIVVIDLWTGKTDVCANTTAWDSQVGSHVQWGTSDRELYFNTIEQEHPRGVVLNIFTKERRLFDCPIYQVSPNGLYSVAPDLTMIKYTQLGYGVFVPHTRASTNASATNGLYLTDLTTGKCRLLVSLHDIAVFAKIPPSTPMYGFHTKWSSDGEMIMFVVRTLTPASQGLLSSLLPTQPKMARINHMFVVSIAGEILAHVVSWGTACSLLPTAQYGGRVTHVVGDIAVRGDGNHPNWIPGTHNISINYRQTCDYPISSGPGSVPVWKIAVFDVDAIIRSSAKGHMAITDSFAATARRARLGGTEMVDRTGESDASSNRGVIAHPWGTGHPTFLPGGRYAIVDAYLKEQRMFGSSLDGSAGHEGMLPLRLVDLLTQKEVWLMQVMIVAVTLDVAAAL